MTNAFKIEVRGKSVDLNLQAGDIAIVDRGDENTSTGSSHSYDTNDTYTVSIL